MARQIRKILTKQGLILEPGILEPGILEPGIYPSINLALLSTLPCDSLRPLVTKIMSLTFIDPILDL